MMTSAVRAHSLEAENETALVLCRDALVSLLADENVRRTGKHLQVPLLLLFYSRAE